MNEVKDENLNLKDPKSEVAVGLIKTLIGLTVFEADLKAASVALKNEDMSALPDANKLIEKFEMIQKGLNTYRAGYTKIKELETVVQERKGAILS